MENMSSFRIAGQKLRNVISKWSSLGAAENCHCLCGAKSHIWPSYKRNLCSYSTIVSCLRSNFPRLFVPTFSVSINSNFAKSQNVNRTQDFQRRNFTFTSQKILRAANKENVSVKPTTTDYIDCSDSKILDLIKDDFLVYEDFVTEEEEKSILQEIEPYLNRLKYEQNHWDDAIHGFRETERKKWTEKNKAIIQRVRDLAFPPGVQQMAYVHILDIKKAGYIKPHVDAVRFCGDTIAGISLLSPAVMRLVHTENKDWFADALLKRRSLYIMRHTARYQFSHEVLCEECSKFKGEIVPRDRRISVICRNEPSPEDRQ